MSSGRNIALVISLVAYYGAIIYPLQGRTDSNGPVGVGALTDLKLETARLDKSVSALEKELADQAEKLRDRYGGLRLIDTQERVPLNILMQTIVNACRTEGIPFHDLQPIAPAHGGILELEGATVTVDLPSEGGWIALQNRIREKSKLEQMTHSVSLFRDGEGNLHGKLAFSFLYKSIRPGKKAPPVDFSAWLALQRPRRHYVNLYLLSHRPPPQSAVPPPPPTRAPPPTTPPPAPVSVAPAGPPPFAGKLRGVSSAGGVDVALIDAGSEQVVAVGEEVAGWTVSRVFADHAVLTAGGQSTTIWISDFDRPAETPAASAAPEPSGPAARYKSIPVLGLQGRFMPVTAEMASPALAGRSRVFVVSVVLPDTLAGRAGVRADDRILFVDSTRFQVSEQLLAVRSRLAAGRSVTLQVERNGSVLAIDLVP